MMMTSGDSFKYGGFVSCTKYILQKEGLKYLYKGWQLSFFQAFGAAGCLFFLDSISTDLKRKAGIEWVFTFFLLQSRSDNRLKFKIVFVQ